MALRFSTGLRNKILGINTNKFTNGLFTTDTTGWTAIDAVLSSVAGGQSGNCLQIAESGGANPGKAYQDVTTKIGHWYVLQVYFKKGTSDSGKVMVGTTGDEDSIWDTGAKTDAGWTLIPGYDGVDDTGVIVFAASATTTRITLQSTDAIAGETSLFDEVKLISLSRAIQDVFKDGFINFYSGSQPASANDAYAGTLLVTMYSNGVSAGLEFDDAVSAIISKKSTETWSGTAIATGTAGWFRLYAPGDVLGSSTVDERIDGAISTSGAELNMASTSIVISSVISINTFQIELEETQ